jgi:DNA-binding transcriptional regulator YiaG
MMVYERLDNIIFLDPAFKFPIKWLAGMQRPLSDRNEFKEVRIRLKMTQKRLGKLFGVSGHTVSRWERGITTIDGSAQIMLRIIELENEDKI